jgi:hypothetical protein
MNIKKIPVGENKNPLVPNWQTSEEEFDISNSPNVGMVCGRLSGSVEVIDIDLKNDTDKAILLRYKELIMSYDSALLKKLVIQETRNGGYHFIYRCSKIEGNQKLASRKSTLLELSKSPNRVKVLIETRGEGGQILIPPSAGYKVVYGSLDNINEITERERDILITCAKALNEVVEEIKPKFINSPSGLGRMTPWDDYNNRGDVVSLLESHGWTYVKTHGPRIYLKRPGDTDSLLSGDYNTELNLFKVFSTSTEFEEGKGYKPSAVFALLECGNDFSLAAKNLYNMGYGERNTYKPEKELVVEQVKEEDNVEDFFASSEIALDYLMQVKEGKIELGKDFGIPELDKHYRFKRGNLIMINGVDNVGKTFMILYLMHILAKRHGLRFLIYTTENEHYSVYEDLCQFYLKKPIKQMLDDEIKESHKWVSEHFIFIKLSEKLYSHKEILKIAKGVNDKYGIDGMLIDPWYSILDGDFEHGSSYNVIMEIKAFCKVNGISTMINIHVGTNAARNKDKEGNLIAPGKADTEGGQKFANVVDDFLTVHRNFNNPDESDITEIHVRKIKETKTGGKITQMLNPIKFKIMANFSGFNTYLGAFNVVDHTVTIKEMNEHEELDSAPF